MDTTIGTARQMNHDFVLTGDFKNTALNDLSFSLNGTVKESHDRGESSNLLISPLGEVRQNTRTGDNGNDIMSISHRAKSVKLSSSFKLSASLNSMPQFLQDKLAKTSTYRLGTEVRGIYRPTDNLNISINLDASYLHSNSSLSGLLTSAIASEARLAATYNFTRKTQISATGTINRHDYIAGAGRSNMYVPMSIGISHKLKNLSIHVSAQDLLNRASNYTASTTADYHMERWVPFMRALFPVRTYL